jgi:hypothetical protein
MDASSLNNNASHQPTADASRPRGADPALQRDAEAETAPAVGTTPRTADPAPSPAGDPPPPSVAAAKVPTVPGLSAEAQKYVQLLGPAPVVEGEDAARYHRLLVDMAKILQPLDVVDWILLKDFIDNQWELMRYRQAQADLITDAQMKAENDPVEFVAATGPIGIARAIAAQVATLNTLDGMVMSKEGRRGNAYSEFRRRRDRKLDSSDGLVDAEYCVIEDQAA